jgi:hypothetical protein
LFEGNIKQRKGSIARKKNSKHKNRAGGVAQAVEGLPNKRKALSSGKKK